MFKRTLVDSQMRENAVGRFVYNLELLVHDHGVIFLRREIQQMRCTVIPFRQWVSAPYVHCHSIEGDMRILMEHSIAMLHSSGLPFFLWCYALLCCVFCLNRSFTKVHYNPSHKYVVPWERRFGERTSIEDMVKFGAKVYVYVNEQDRNALQSHVWIG